MVPSLTSVPSGSGSAAGSGSNTILSSPFLNLRTINGLLSSHGPSNTGSNPMKTEERIQLLSAKISLLVDALPKKMGLSSYLAQPGTCSAPAAGNADTVARGPDGSKLNTRRGEMKMHVQEAQLEAGNLNGTGNGTGREEGEQKEENVPGTSPQGEEEALRSHSSTQRHPQPGPPSRNRAHNAQLQPASQATGFPENQGPTQEHAQAQAQAPVLERDRQLYEICKVRYDLALSCLSLVAPDDVQAEVQLSLVEKNCRFIIKRHPAAEDTAEANEVNEWMMNVRRLRRDTIVRLVEVEEGLGREKRAERWRGLLAELRD